MRTDVAGPSDALAPAVVARGTRTWQRFKRHGLALMGLGVIVLLIVIAILAPRLAPHDPTAQDLAHILAAPSVRHPMGTDDLGRDVFSRVLLGARVSLAVAFSAVGILIFVGTVVGVIAGYYRALDGVLMRVVDVLMSVPSVFLILVIVGLLGPGLWKSMAIIGLTAWMGTARLVRGQFLSLRDREFVEAARALGASGRRIIWAYLMPNTHSLITVQATLYLSYAVITESLLSYLGLGTQPPTPSWGSILSSGRNFMREAWWMTVFPGSAIFVTVLAFNFFGDGLRDVLDPRGQTS